MTSFGAVCTTCENLATNFRFLFHLQIPNLNLIPGLLEEIFLPKQLEIIDQ